MKRWFVYLTILASLGLMTLPAGAAQTRSADRIWVIGSSTSRTLSGSMHYGDTFSAGWQSSKTQYPWGYAKCWTASGNVFWSEYRALQGDGTIGVFEFASADPAATWPADGGTCTVSLLVKQGGKQVISATSDPFSVAA